MRVHHLNCGTMRPYGGRLISGTGSPFGTAPLVCHCLLVETDEGLVLVDTGFGLQDVAAPGDSLGRQFLLLVRPRLDAADTAVRQVARLGFDPADVRHIVLTHLDPDHAGGLRDFPKAKVHLHAGDAYFHHGATEPVRPRVPPGLALFETLVQVDRDRRRHNRDRLRELRAAHGDEVHIFSAHDPGELPLPTP